MAIRVETIKMQNEAKKINGNINKYCIETCVMQTTIYIHFLNK